MLIWQNKILIPPIKLPSMFLPGQHHQQLTQVYPKKKRFFLPFDTPSDLNKLLCSESSFFFVCLLLGLCCFYFPLALLILPRCVTEPHSLVPGLGGELWKQHENQDEAFCFGDGGGISDWWRACALKPAGRYFSCTWAFEEDRTAVPLFKTT